MWYPGKFYRKQFRVVVSERLGQLVEMPATTPTTRAWSRWAIQRHDPAFACASLSHSFPRSPTLEGWVMSPTWRLSSVVLRYDYGSGEYLWLQTSVGRPIAPLISGVRNTRSRTLLLSGRTVEVVTRGPSSRHAPAVVLQPVASVVSRW